MDGYLIGGLSIGRSAITMIGVANLMGIQTPAYLYILYLVAAGLSVLQTVIVQTSFNPTGTAIHIAE